MVIQAIKVQQDLKAHQGIPVILEHQVLVVIPATKDRLVQEPKEHQVTPVILV